jgi:hypothetical protein
MAVAASVGSVAGRWQARREPETSERQRSARWKIERASFGVGVLRYLLSKFVIVTEAGEKFTVMQKRPVERHEEAAKSAARVIASSLATLGRRTLPRPVWDAACDDIDHLFRHELVSGLVDVNSIEKVGIYRLIV